MITVVNLNLIIRGRNDKFEIDMNVIYKLWNQKLIESMIETVNNANAERKTRTRK